MHLTPARDQARGRLGRNSCPWGQNLALNWAQGEVGVSLKKKKKKNFFFFNFHLICTQLHTHKLWYLIRYSNRHSRTSCGTIAAYFSFNLTSIVYIIALLFKH